MHNIQELQPNPEYLPVDIPFLLSEVAVESLEQMTHHHTEPLNPVISLHIETPISTNTKDCFMQDTRLRRLVHEIHEKHGRMILRLSSAQNLQQADQQNLVQDVYLKLITSIGGLRDEEKTESWVKTVFFSTRNNYMRKNKNSVNNKELATEEVENYAHRRKVYKTENTDETAISNVQHTEVLKNFYEVVRKWANTKHQKVVILHFIHQKSYREIAAETGIKENTCKIIIHRKRVELMEALQTFRQDDCEEAA